MVEWQGSATGLTGNDRISIYFPDFVGLVPALIISLAQKFSRDLGFYGFAALTPTLTRNLTYFLICICHVMSRDQNNFCP